MKILICLVINTSEIRFNYACVMDKSVGFISFGDGAEFWKDTAARLTNIAIDSKWFSSVFNANLNYIRDELDKTCSPDFLLNRGLGFWIWKPFAISKFAKENLSLDAIVYLDGGSHLNVNSNSEQLFRSYLDVVLSGPGLLASQTEHLEIQWSKRDLIDKFPPEYRFTGQLQASFIFGRPKSLIDLCESWIELCRVENFRFLDDTASLMPEYPEFIEHRHDQSIFSLLLKGSNYSRISADRTWSSNWSNLVGDPFWITRHKTNTPFGKRTLKSEWRTLKHFLRSSMK